MQLRDEWYARTANGRFGPMTRAVLDAMKADNQIQPPDKIRQEMRVWRRASRIVNAASIRPDDSRLGAARSSDSP